MRLEYEAGQTERLEAPRQREIVDDPRYDIGPDVDVRVVGTAQQLTRSV
jgi:hypothetical protein